MTAASPQPGVAPAALVDECRDLASRAAERLGTRVHLMEVCGTHSHAIARAGIRGLLGDDVRLVSGPGCPVCVTDAAQIDLSIQLAQRDDPAGDAEGGAEGLEEGCRRARQGWQQQGCKEERQADESDPSRSQRPVTRWLRRARKQQALSVVRRPDFLELLSMP